MVGDPVLGGGSRQVRVSGARRRQDPQIGGFLLHGSVVEGELDGLRRIVLDLEHEARLLAAVCGVKHQIKIWPMPNRTRVRGEADVGAALILVRAVLDPATTARAPTADRR